MKKDVCGLCGSIEDSREITNLPLWVRGKDGVRVCDVCLDHLSDIAQMMAHHAQRVFVRLGTRDYCEECAGRLIKTLSIF